MKILFLDDCNGHEGQDPRATLIEVSDYTDIDILKRAERKQLGVSQMGGCWQNIMKDMGLVHLVLSEGNKSDFAKAHDLSTYVIYNLISGNY